MNPFSSDQVDVSIHPSGFVRLPSGVAVSRLPIWDSRYSVFARLGHGSAAQALEAIGMRTPTVEEYAELHSVALHVDPYYLPTAAMISAAGVPKPWRDAAGRDSHAMATYRAEDMRSLLWSQLHDTEVFARLDASGWTNEPVANAGKHWATHGGVHVLTGWYARNGRALQHASTAHLNEPMYTDYATTVHAAYDAASTPELPPPTSVSKRDTDPAPDWKTGLDLREHNVGLRCLAWLGFQSQLGISEVPGPKHDSRIVAYSQHCRRGGTFLGVDGRGLPIWRGGNSLALSTDEEPWCAAITSAALLESLLVGEHPPHGLRVSVRELCEDARIAATLRPLQWYPPPGALAICARSGQNPLHGGRGHVRRVVTFTEQRHYGIGGNESDRIVAAWHDNAEVVAWIDCS